MNESPYFISGKKRRALKKELSSLKSSIKGFWHFEQLDIDMGGVDDKEWANQRYNKLIKERNRLDFFLSLGRDEMDSFECGE